jgi:hypothetical protein
MCGLVTAAPPAAKTPTKTGGLRRVTIPYMAVLSKQDVISALARMGDLAHARGESIELLLLGGSVMVLVFETRQSTRDVDVVILHPVKTAQVRAMAQIVAQERGWPADWLNDGAKGFMVGITQGPVVFTAPGIVVRTPAIHQLLAMKLCAWRDDVDIADARRLLRELQGTRQQVWEMISPHLQRGRELKASYAFEDLWEESHGAH